MDSRKTTFQDRLQTIKYIVSTEELKSKKLICPLSGKMMNDPVIAPDGRTYERETIEQKTPEWKSTLRPNIDKRRQIESFVTQKEKEFKDSHPEPAKKTNADRLQAVGYDVSTEQNSQELDDKGFTCCVSLTLYEDPVIAADGNTYERSFIEKWLANNNSSPLNHEPFENKDLIPNIDKLEEIEEFIVKKEKELSEAKEAKQEVKEIKLPPKAQIGAFFMPPAQKKSKKELPAGKLEQIHEFFAPLLDTFLKNPNMPFSQTDAHFGFIAAVTLVDTYIKDGYEVKLNQEAVVAYNLYKEITDARKKLLVNLVVDSVADLTGIECKPRDYGAVYHVEPYAIEYNSYQPMITISWDKYFWEIKIRMNETGDGVCAYKHYEANAPLADLKKALEETKHLFVAIQRQPDPVKVEEKKEQKLGLKC